MRKEEGVCSLPFLMYRAMGKLVFPPFLQKGDKVIVLSPSGKIDRNVVMEAKKRLMSWGLEVTVSKHCADNYASFSGTVQKRLSDLQTALDDETAKAILCSRGGYGAQHLMGKLDFSKFKEYPKWLIGFSDITALHCYIQQQGFASLHAPMARHLAEEPADDFATEAIRKLLFGEAEDKENLITYTCPAHPLNHRGKAEGILRGGNFAVYYGLRGTAYDIPADGTILFLEDVGERPHAVERMLYNLKIGGVLERLSGLIIGQFTEYTENMGLGKELYGALADVVKEYAIPICFNFPVGHVKENYPLIEGSRVRLEIGKQTKLTIEK